MVKRKFFVLAMFLTCAASLFSQQIIEKDLVACSGESFVVGKYQLEWAIGECVVAYHSSNAMELSQGFYSLSVYEVTAIKTSDKPLLIKVFPVPAEDYLTIAFPKNFSIRELSYKLVAVDGKILLGDEIETERPTIDLSLVPPGVYALSLKSKSQLIGSYKIIKK